MEHILSIILAFIIVILYARFIMSRKEKDKSSENFYVKPQAATAFIIGSICIIIFGHCLYLAISTNTTNIILMIFLIGMISIGILIILTSFDGFWCFYVEKDTITKKRFGKNINSINFSDIDYCNIVRGYLDIYVKNQNKPKYKITNSDENIYTLINKMKDENIPIKGRRII